MLLHPFFAKWVSVIPLDRRVEFIHDLSDLLVGALGKVIYPNPQTKPKPVSDPVDPEGAL